VTYEEDTLNANKWQAGIRRVLDETENSMDSFLLGSDYGLSIPTDTPDAWDNYKPTYCWMDRGSFVPKDSLLKGYRIR